MLTHTATASIESPNVEKNRIPIGHDTRGRISQMNELKLVYDDSNRIYSVTRHDFTQNNLYDGSYHRVKVYYTVPRSGKSTSSSGQPKVSDLRFTSITGRLLHQSLRNENVSKDSIIYSGEPEDYDLIEFGNSLSLRFGDCATWLVQIGQNNLFIALNPDNSLQGVSSIGPFGNSIGGTGATKDSCESHPVPTPIWPWIFPFGPIHITSPDPANANLLNNESDKDYQYIYRNVHRDTITNFLLLPTSRFYFPKIGRYLAPEFTSPNSNFNQIPTNWYSIEGNNPIDSQVSLSIDHGRVNLNVLSARNGNKSSSSFDYLRK